MGSPFPGMNPYLEQEYAWLDFHQSFIPAAREMLNQQIRPGYNAKVEEHLFVHELSAEERRFFGQADLQVMETGGPGKIAAQPGVLSPPAYGVLSLAVDIERHAFVEIRDRQSRALVTVIELLSPSNKKSGSDRDQYLFKRRQYLMSGVHLVEIDLLRGWPRLPVEELPDCDYCVLVSRAEERPRVGIWPIRLREPLPVIPVPLKLPDADARLDLQGLLHRVYDAAGYEDYIYQGKPQPPLVPDDEVWARTFLPPA